MALASGAADYYRNSYQDARREFLDNITAVQAQNPSAVHEALQVPSAHDQDLFIDTLYLPPKSQAKKRLLVLTSGVHGIEAFVGSALQNYFLHENFWGLRDESLGILLIHSVNPYGFKHERRVSEQNVDLNRNFEINQDIFTLENPGYTQVRNLLNPTEAADTSLWWRIKFYARTLMAILRYSMETLRRAVLRGQYEYPDGIYFGGRAFEPQRDLLRKVLTDKGQGYDQILLVDLHTGYGERGHLHLFADHSPDLDESYLTKIFQGFDLDWGQKKNFYQTTGGFVVFAAKLFPKPTRFAGMTFEFGTLNSQTTFGSLESIYRMVLENQAFHHGAESEFDAAETHALFREMFNPSNQEWRESTLQRFHEVLSQALKNQAVLNSAK